MIGKKYGRLFIVDQYYKKDKNGYNIDYCLCKCDCGSHYKEIRGINIRKKLTSSCGCYKLEKIIESSKKYNEYNLNNKYGIGYTAKNIEFYFDLDDYEKIKDYCWSYNKSTGIYAHDLGKKRGSHIKMHNLILGNSNVHKLIDHINRDNKDNRKNNLRYANKSQNGMNAKLKSNNKTGVTGVFWNKNTKKYMAYITINNKRINLGSAYLKRKDAIIARLLAEKKYFKNFAPQEYLFNKYGMK